MCYVCSAAQSCPTLCTPPWTAACHAPLPMGFSRQAPSPGVETTPPALAAGFFTTGLSSVQFSPPVVSDSLPPHESQHARPPCPSPTPVVHPNPCPSSRWCHLTISSSVDPFSSCPQSFPASGPFPMSQLFIRWPSIGVSASASVLPMNTQDWSLPGM